MTAHELKQKFLTFFEKKGHKKLPNVSLIPENDPTTLFISAGMHPLVPYLLGEPHPLGKRLVSVQRCLRTDDIESVGDGFHHTFFEMLGNWSLGDPEKPDGIGAGYWKKEAISWSWEFLTEILKINPQKIAVSCFLGDKDASKDEESAKIWQGLGVSKEKIFFLGRKHNWWGPVGKTGPCGPDTEMFFDTDKPKCSPTCDVSCQCSKYIEIWNDVFMQYNRTSAGKYETLKQKNVDTGMGVERVTAVINGFNDDNYKTELFSSLINQIERISGKKYEKDNQKPMRIIADHLRATVFLLADDVLPSNVEQGYVLRRLIRRAVRFGRPLQLNEPFTVDIAEAVIELMKENYPYLATKKDSIFSTLKTEEEKFIKALENGLRELEKHKVIDAKIAFYLYETYGLPLEIIEGIAREKGQKIEEGLFEKEFKKHQQISKKGFEKKFSGGLANHSGTVTKLHTATHLLHQALREVLGKHVRQFGSNITPERLRFDFIHPEKLTLEQIAKVEKIVNQKIKKNLAVKMEIMTLEEAKKKGVLAFFTEKYQDKVKVYSIGDYSLEVCAGPHVVSTGEIGGVRIIKEESVGAGKRRIYARLVNGRPAYGR